MIQFPGAKINIGLRVLDKRSDGFHSLESIFLPIAWKDALEVIPHPSNENNKTNIYLSGLPVEGSSSDNLIYKAWELLNKNFGIPTCDIYLLKNIPMGAGMGGGSSDGASALKMLAELNNLDLNNDDLAALALQLGSDCPFFIYNQPAYVTGRGEIFEFLPSQHFGLQLQIIYPSLHIGTAEAYKNIERFTHPKISLKEAFNQPIESWKNYIFNDFENYAFKVHPELQQIKDKLYDAGAVYASMSGSGSAMYGIFKNETYINWPQHYTVKNISI